MLTTMYSNGRFWVVNSVTFKKVSGYPSFATIDEAIEAIGDLYEDPQLEG